MPSSLGTLVQAEKESILPDPNGDDIDMDWDNGPDDDDDEPFPWAMDAAAAGGHGPALERQADSAIEAPAWKNQLSKLTSGLMQNAGYGPNGQPIQRTASQTWPSNRRILYVVDRAGLNGGQRCAFPGADLRNRRRDGQWEKPKHLKISRDQIAQLPDEVDLADHPNAAWSAAGRLRILQLLRLGSAATFFAPRVIAPDSV